MSKDTNVRSQRRPATYWLIVKRGAGLEERLTVNSDDGGKALAVFSFEEEADMFVSLSSVGTGWQPRRATARELTGMLLSSCAGVGYVSLDPLPELVQSGMIGLVSVSRKHFVEQLVENAAEATTLVS
ncbi:MAG: hypothetical protein WA982_10995 [Rubrobacteraceae bacterium]